MKDLRIGLVGTGGIGRIHIERVNNTLQGGKVVACSDPAGAFDLSIAKKYGIKGFENPIDMINDPEIDASMCTTADPYHEEYVLASIAAGKYVFCEKPLVPKADACKRIVEAEMKAGKQLVQVGFMRRYDTGYKQLKAAVDSKQYGEPLLPKAGCGRVSPHPVFLSSSSTNKKQRVSPSSCGFPRCFSTLFLPFPAQSMPSAGGQYCAGSAPTAQCPSAHDTICSDTRGSSRHRHAVQEKPDVRASASVFHHSADMPERAASAQNPPRDAGLSPCLFRGRRPCPFPTDETVRGSPMCTGDSAPPQSSPCCVYPSARCSKI